MSTITLDKRVIDTELKENGTPIFNTKDRCDRCGAQAYVKHTLESGKDLYWCSHHANKYRPIMVAQGVLWKSYSEVNRLKEDRKKGSEN